MKVFVDGDLLVFRSCFAAERTEYAVEYTDADSGEDVRVWCENKANADLLLGNLGARGVIASLSSQRKLEPFSHAVNNLKNIISAIEEGVASTDLVVALSGKDNFREHVATIKPYKGNRDPNQRPTFEQEMREFIRINYPTMEEDGQEADDSIGIAQWTSFTTVGDPFATCIASADKDLLMIPGLHFNFLKPAQPLYVSEDLAMDTFLTQWLTGDSTDNIPGVPKIGPKKATAALEGLPTLKEKLDRVAELYRQGYGDDNYMDAMIENGRLVWIRRRPNEMFDCSTPLLYGI